MAANLDLLNPQLKAKVITLVARCANRGFEMRPNNGLRDPFARQGFGGSQDRLRR